MIGDFVSGLFCVCGLLSSVLAVILFLVWGKSETRWKRTIARVVFIISGLIGGIYAFLFLLGLLVLIISN
jgi:hypothetical protein